MNTNWQYEYFRYLLRVFRHGFRSDKNYRVRKFERDFGFTPNLTTPQTFNEKVLYRMINPSRANLFTQLADKLKAREYAGEINRGLLSEIYGVFDKVEDIDTYYFPEKFVLKCNHDTGSFLICKDKNSFDLERAKSKLSLHMRMNMYYRTREWQYRKIKPVVFCEEYIDRGCMMYSGLTPDVFRFHCFDSCALFVEVEYTDDRSNSYTNIYDNRWNVQPVRLNGRHNTPGAMPKPEKFDEAILNAESLSKGLDYCRVDLYITSTRVYFSEFTFAPNNGREKFSPAAWDVIFGQNWNLTR